jgi:exodeoxyribonuclease VII small subunit
VCNLFARPATCATQRVRSDPLARDDTTIPDFEQALAELEGLVERLERGDLPLDEALKTFERGVALTRHCQASLKAAQQKVEILLKREVEPFTVPPEEPAAGAALDRIPGT